MVAAPLAVLLRFDGNVPTGRARSSPSALGVLCALAQVALGYAMLLYRGRYRFGSFDEVLGVVAHGRRRHAGAPSWSPSSPSPPGCPAPRP